MIKNMGQISAINKGDSMDIGIGIAGVAISAGAVVITAIKVKANNSNNSNGTCHLHSGIEATLKYLVDKADETGEDIKKILGKIGGV